MNAPARIDARKIRSALVHAIAAGGLLLVFGCGRGRSGPLEIINVPIEPVQGVGVAGAPGPSGTSGQDPASQANGSNLVPGAGDTTAQEIGTGPGGTPAGTSIEAFGNDKVMKAHIYWKIRWLRDVLGAPKVGQEVFTELADVQKKLTACLADGYKPDMQKALDDMATAADAYKKQDDWSTAGIDINSIPWGIGRDAMETTLNQRIADAEAKGALDPAIAALKAHLTEILDFEEKNHRSPSDTRQAAIAAGGKLNEEVADRMDRDRILSHDHPIGRELNPGPDTAISGRMALPVLKH